MSAIFDTHAHYDDKAFDGIPFRMIIGMRNILVHDYGAIDWILVWDTIQQDIPPLFTHVSSLINALEAD